MGTTSPGYAITNQIRRTDSNVIAGRALPVTSGTNPGALKSVQTTPDLVARLAVPKLCVLI